MSPVIEAHHLIALLQQFIPDVAAINAFAVTST